MEYRQAGSEEPGREAVTATAAAELARLLARARNAADLDRGLARQLADALLHHSEVRSSCWHNAQPILRCSVRQHAFLLADGSSATLWELQHTTAEGDPPRHEVYADRESLRQAEYLVCARLGIAGRCGLDDLTACSTSVSAPAVSPPAEEPVYSRQDSAEHARRLLRRAENPDRPGRDVLHLLRDAYGHRIAHLPKPCGAQRHQHVWCSIYEHAFLITGGHEISLYELEHNLTSDGQLVCEVYLDEATADQAADRYARVYGVEL